MEDVRALLKFQARVAGWMLLALALGFLAFVAVGPRVAGYRTMTVLTGSMDPAIPQGSLVMVTGEPPWGVRPGDVLVYEAPTPDRPVVVHRVLATETRPEGLVVQTKGDANDAPDPWQALVKDREVWRVRLVLARLGWVIRGLRSPVASGALRFGAPALLALCWLARIWGAGRRPAHGGAHA